MPLLKKPKRSFIILGFVLGTLLALVILTLPANKPAQNIDPKKPAGQPNRPAVGAVPGPALTDAQIATYQDKLKKAPDLNSYVQLVSVKQKNAREMGGMT